MRIPLASIAALFILTVSSTAWACDCGISSPDKSFRDADVVFEGIVDRKIPTSSGTTYTFQVMTSLKGVPASEFTLEQGSSNCDPTFLQSTIYRVYAHRREGKLFSSECFGNQVLGVFQQKNFQQKKEHAEWRLTTSLQFILFLFVGIGLTAVGIWLWDRRKP